VADILDRIIRQAIITNCFYGRFIMALKPCRECEKEVATDATTCPHCGCKSPVANAEVILKGVGVLVVLAVFAYVWLTN